MADILDFPRERSAAPENQPDPLWREELGRSLRTARERRGERLVDVAERAGVSPQYLSEMERGCKEPSSEMIGAVTGALGIALPDLLIDIAGDLRSTRAPATGRPTGPVLMAA